MQVHIKLKAWLMTRKLRQGDLAQMVGVTEAAVSEWINDKRKPSRESAYRIERVTDEYVKQGDWSDG